MAHHAYPQHAPSPRPHRRQSRDQGGDRLHHRGAEPRPRPHSRHRRRGQRRRHLRFRQGACRDLLRSRPHARPHRLLVSGQRRAVLRRHAVHHGLRPPVRGHAGADVAEPFAPARAARDGGGLLRARIHAVQRPVRAHRRSRQCRLEGACRRSRSHARGRPGHGAGHAGPGAQDQSVPARRHARRRRSRRPRRRRAGQSFRRGAPAEGRVPLMPAAPKAIRREDYRPPDYRIETVDLDFDLGAEATRVKAKLAIRAADEGATQPLVLDGDELKLVSIALDGNRLAPGDYAIDDKSLTIARPPKSFTLAIETEIAPAANTKLSGLYRSSGVFCTQCEAEGFRRITYFLDRPDVMTVYRTTIRADRAACPVLLSNGNLVGQGALDGGRHFAVWQDPFPKPSYLFALVAGDLACREDKFTTRSGRDVRLRIFVEHGKVPRTEYAMDALKRAMRWDEERFGL